MPQMKSTKNFDFQGSVTDIRTNRRMDELTDKPSYRDTFLMNASKNRKRRKGLRKERKKRREKMKREEKKEKIKRKQERK